ncbi:MAG: MBL fold metallo-hydrolase [Holophagaceae bacterium]|nr:MBL fold metallo-hydrolase [Holophagaceae bacterium]
MLDYEILCVGSLGCNCVILWNSESVKGLVVDPGDEAERISGQVAKRDIDILAILLTHAHFDHLGAAASLQAQWKCPVFLHPEDIPMLDQLEHQTAKFRMPSIAKPVITMLEDDVPLGIKVIHTPGHSPGSSTFLAESSGGKIALTGDTIFAKGVGRTDLWGGSWELLENSIKTKLYALDPNTLIIPGHGANSTIASERNGNPYVKG